SDGTGFTLAVPGKSVTADTAVPLVVTTDFGKVTASVTVVAAKSPTLLSGAAFSVGSDTGITLTASDPLKDLTYADGTWIVAKNGSTVGHQTVAITGGKVSIHISNGEI